MKEAQITMHEPQFQRIKTVIARLCHETAARLVLLIHRDGQPIAFHGDAHAVDTTSFSSLAAGNVAATSSMARLIGEKAFPALSHEGERESIYISVIGQTLLVLIFDERSTIGLVKLRVKRASLELSTILDELMQLTVAERGKEAAMFSEISDDDIDSLFS